RDDELGRGGPCGDDRQADDGRSHARQQGDSTRPANERLTADDEQGETDEDQRPVEEREPELRTTATAGSAEPPRNADKMRRPGQLPPPRGGPGQKSMLSSNAGSTVLSQRGTPSP